MGARGAALLPAASAAGVRAAGEVKDEGGGGGGLSAGLGADAGLDSGGGRLGEANGLGGGKLGEDNLTFLFLPRQKMNNSNNFVQDLLFPSGAGRSIPPYEEKALPHAWDRIEPRYSYNQFPEQIRIETKIAFSF